MRQKIDLNRVVLAIWESSENQYGGPKKNSKMLIKFRKVFENPPPRENPGSAPAYVVSKNLNCDLVLSSYCCLKSRGDFKKLSVDQTKLDVLK